MSLCAFVYCHTSLITTSRVTWKIHESKNHLATLPEARTVTLSMIGHVQFLALSHAGVGMQSVGTRRAAAR